MSIIKKMRKQKAVWWERQTEPQDRFGNFGFNEPVEIDCRWDDTAQEFTDSQGQLQISRSLVYVDRVMKPGDRLKLGEMDSETPLDPLEVQDAFAIKRFDQNPNLKATEFLLTAYL